MNKHYQLLNVFFFVCFVLCGFNGYYQLNAENLNSCRGIWNIGDLFGVNFDHHYSISNNDNHFFLSLTMGSTENRLEGRLIKLNPDGGIVWDRRYTFGGNTSSIFAVNSRGVALGITKVDTHCYGWLLGFNQEGNRTWEKILPENPGNSSYQLLALTETRDRKFLAAGVKIGAVDSALQIIKFSQDGEIDFQKMYPLTNYMRVPVSIAQDSAGHFYIAGSSIQLQTKKIQAFIMKINASGNLIWENIYESSQYTSINSIVPYTGTRIRVPSRTDLNINSTERMVVAGCKGDADNMEIRSMWAGLVKTNGQLEREFEFPAGSGSEFATYTGQIVDRRYSVFPYVSRLYVGGIHIEPAGPGGTYKKLQHRIYFVDMQTGRWTKQTYNAGTINSIDANNIYPGAIRPSSTCLSVFGPTFINGQCQLKIFHLNGWTNFSLSSPTHDFSPSTLEN